jgi:hypothetical protein
MPVGSRGKSAPPVGSGAPGGPRRGPGASTPRPSYGDRRFAGDLPEEATDLDWDAQKRDAARGEVQLGPRPPWL